MSRPVYSAQFIVYTDAAPNSEFEVPEGFTAVVRQCTLFTQLGAANAQPFFSDAPGAPGVTFASLTTAGVAQADQWQGHVVVPGGGFIVLNINTILAGSQFYAGGYLLRDD